MRKTGHPRWRSLGQQCPCSTARPKAGDVLLSVLSPSRVHEPVARGHDEVHGHTGTADALASYANLAPRRRDGRPRLEAERARIVALGADRLSILAVPRLLARRPRRGPTALPYSAALQHP